MSEKFKKPRIWATCKAGCQWETVHKDDLNEVMTFVPVYADREDGGITLKKGVTYKIFTKEDDRYGFNITIRFGNVSLNVQKPAFDKYKNYVLFKLLDVVLDEDSKKTIVAYEIDGKFTRKEFVNGLVETYSRMVVFNKSSGMVAGGDGVDYFTYTTKQVEEGVKEITVRAEYKFEGLTPVVYWTGNMDAVREYEAERWDYATDPESIYHDDWDCQGGTKITKFDWKQSFTDTNGITHTLLEDTETSVLVQTAWSGGGYVVWDTRVAKFTESSHKAIDTFEWDETITLSDKTLVYCCEEHTDTTYTAHYYDPNKEIDLDDYGCFVNDFDYVVEYNGDVSLTPESLFIRYAEDARGLNMSETYSGQPYLGTYKGKKASESEDDYTWMYVGGGENGGSGFEVIDITGADDCITLEQLAKLPYCYVKDGELIYRLSYVDSDCWYYENTDETVYRYLTIYNDGNFSRHEPKDMSGSGIVVIEKAATMSEETYLPALTESFTAEEYESIKENNAEIHVEIDLGSVKQTYVFRKLGVYEITHEGQSVRQEIYHCGTPESSLNLIIIPSETGEIVSAIQENGESEKIVKYRMTLDDKTFVDFFLTGYLNDEHLKNSPIPYSVIQSWFLNNHAYGFKLTEVKEWTNESQYSTNWSGSCEWYAGEDGHVKFRWKSSEEKTFDLYGDGETQAYYSIEKEMTIV